jgi:hypothetical protein
MPTWGTPQPIDLMWSDALLKRHQNVQTLKDDAMAKVKSPH